MQFNLEIMIGKNTNQEKTGNPDKGYSLEKTSGNRHFKLFSPITSNPYVWFLFLGEIVSNSRFSCIKLSFSPMKRFYFPGILILYFGITFPFEIAISLLFRIRFFNGFR